MKRSKLTVLLTAGILGLSSVSVMAADAPPAVGLNNPFDKNDPQMQKVRDLKWKDIDFNAKDQRTRSVALLALKEVTTRIGGKTDARLDLLITYFDDQKIGEAYAAELDLAPEQTPITFEDARKIAVAFLSSSLGAEKFGDDLEGCDDHTLKAYERLYEKSARASFEQTVASRMQVASMGMFLQKQGKFDAFAKWAMEERQKRQVAYEQANAEKQKQYLERVQGEKEKQAAEYAQYLAKKREAEEKAASQMEAGIQYQEMSMASAPQESSYDTWNGDSYWGWNGAYYSTNAYRGAVADRAQNAYRNWNGGRVRGGGRGGRR